MIQFLWNMNRKKAYDLILHTTTMMELPIHKIISRLFCKQNAKTHTRTTVTQQTMYVVFFFFFWIHVSVESLIVMYALFHFSFFCSSPFSKDVRCLNDILQPFIITVFVILFVWHDFFYTAFVYIPFTYLILS